MTPILEVRQLVKTYKSLKAVNGVSFSIAPGICFGLLGPNGAGKTTTIEVIEGILPPTSGEILYQGRPRSSEFSGAIGIQFQHTALLSFLKVRETLETFQRLYPRATDTAELIEICQLGEVLDQYSDKLSGGQRQRLLLALALVNDPALVFLDEPSTGLDPQARRNLWDIVQQIRDRGKTVILTTHYMEEARLLCDEIAIMDRGRIIEQGSPDALIRTHCGGTTVRLPKQSLQCAPDRLSFPCRPVQGHMEIETDDINTCLRELMANGVDLNDIVVHSPDLEDVFLKLTGRRLRD
ncbi:ABC transporter ATP-binding protein [Desulfonema ishimotonii]|uniref:ABC transporter ATP-binding protein n=2 Tax=Desulfonema ishimotonii TaxID=45657 RepID=A0A401G253_9BACT|nr:ABC transporter ATP-binding protein [Desulfonema ishimotonii]